MCDGSLVGLTTLRLLQLNNCQLRHMPPVTDDTKHTLIVLHLHDNLIANIISTYFHGFVTLTTLSLAKNRLTQIPDVRPVSSTLQVMVLSDNAITNIPRLLLEDVFSTLGLVSLRKNAIKTLPIDVYSAWPAIYLIRMTGNNLSSISPPIQILTNSTHNIRLQLGQNPWRCDSALTWLMESDKGLLEIDGKWQQGRKLGGVWIMDYPDMECAEPPPFSGVWLGYLSKHCMRYKAAYITFYIDCWCVICI